ncbi:AAA family ATPase [Streptomyces sp. AK02-04a]|uniref:AAA family ATPase n=1 Tax=Streptomyces sp. AK02-04a TaxID=3028649 RepID=UPI0029B70D19|nr:AAA family ATPase [Streptomyces sp. AK02-04a]MDX3764101.1 AAA family ATPase [Streptomyces sp. AK02-04a]
MQLVRAHITDYRSVEDSDIFDVEKDVTCLVGKNESGKTTLLQALFRLNPVEPATFDEVADFPARKTSERKKLPAGQKIPVVRATVRFDDAEMKAIQEEFGPKVLRSAEFDVVIGYRKTNTNFTLPYNEAAVVDHLRSTLDLPAEAAKAIGGAKTIADLLDALDELDESPSDAIALARHHPLEQLPQLIRHQTLHDVHKRRLPTEPNEMASNTATVFAVTAGQFGRWCGYGWGPC